ncbi:DUF2179 domain-containing protein [Clostridium haemolyticum]|nr:DUF2179 domain-containing protein [Clostridium haemolyticum]
MKTKLGRGVTLLDAYGCYSHTDKKIYICCSAKNTA